MFSLHKITTIVALMLWAASTKTSAFSVQPTTTGTRSEATRLYFFGGLKDAFKNDESLGPAQNAGLKNGPQYNENVTVNGKTVPGAVVGQKLTVVAGRVRVKIPVNCQKGDCGTCMVKVNGRKVKGKSAVMTAVLFMMWNSSSNNDLSFPFCFSVLFCAACQTALGSGKTSIETL